MFIQTLNPAGHLWLTVLIALVPMIALIFLLVIFRITAWISTILLGVVTIPLAVLVWHAPLAGTMKSYLYGGLTGVWAINWITFWGLIIFNTLVLTGRFRAFQELDGPSRHRRHSHSNDHAGLGFGALLEGLVGFGYPWAVVVPILVGLGIADLDAIRVAALANNAPVSFGALGAPIIGLAAVTGLPLLALSSVHRKSRRGSRFVAAVGPDFSGERVGGSCRSMAFGDRRFFILHRRPVASCALSRSLSSGLERSARFFLDSVSLCQDLASADDSRIRRCSARLGSRADRRFVAALGSVREALSVWLPYIVLVIVVVAWTGHGRISPRSVGIRVSVSAKSSITGKAISSVFNFTPFSGGTSILASWLVILAILRPGGAIVKQVFLEDIQADVGRTAGGVFRFRHGIYFRLFGNGKFAGLRSFEDWSLLHRPGARFSAGSASSSRAATRRRTQCSAPCRR